MEIRTNQQRQNIKESFTSIDSQLTQVSQKLKIAENDLSDYQSQTGITNLDKNSADLVDFLSKLDAEKISNELLLSQYKEKESQLVNIFDKSGYFDQSYLTPEVNNSGNNDAFSSILTKLSELQVRKIELLQKETSSHPDIVNIDNQINQLKKELSTYNQSTLTAYKVIINSLDEKQNKLKSIISKYQSKMHELPSAETKLARLTRGKDVFEKVYNLLLDKREELRVKELAQFQDINIVDSASLPSDPISPKKNLVLVLCLFLWAILVTSYIIIGEFKVRKYLLLEEIEDNLRLPLYSIIPEYPRRLQKRINKTKELSEKFPVMLNDNEGISESYRLLRTRLEFNPNKDDNIIMFTSCEEHSGKTATVANLAMSLISAGKKVLLIDADLKRCGLSDLFCISREIPGLSSFLKGEMNKIPSNKYFESCKQRK